MEKNLIVDTIPFIVRPEVLAEAIRHDGKLLVSGVIQRANAINQNKRLYPKPLLEKVVNNYMTLIGERRSLGELDHPDSAVVNLSNTSHLITELHWEGDDLLGTVEILPTPAGNILKALLTAGVLVGISSRGLGSTRNIPGGAVQVEDDYEILCWDMVSNPSTQGGFMRPITESYDAAKDTKFGKYSRANSIIMDIITTLNVKSRGEL